MKKIGIAVSAVQHRKLANGHKVRVKTGKGILMVNPANFDILHNNFLRGKAKDITLTAEEIMVNRKLNPEFSNKLKTKTKQLQTKVVDSNPIEPLQAQAQEIISVPQEDDMGLNDLFNSGPVFNKLKGSGMHYLARAGIGEFLSNKASEALMRGSGIEFQTKQDRQEGRQEQKYGKFAGGTMTPEERQQASADWRAEQTLAQEQREIQYERERRQAEKDKKQNKREVNAGPFAFLVGGYIGMDANGQYDPRTPEGQEQRRQQQAKAYRMEEKDIKQAKAQRNAGPFAIFMGGRMGSYSMSGATPQQQDADRQAYIDKHSGGTGFKKVGLSRTGNFVASQALQSQPYSENFQFRNMFPPTFTGHML